MPGVIDLWFERQDVIAQEPVTAAGERQSGSRLTGSPSPGDRHVRIVDPYCRRVQRKTSLLSEQQCRHGRIQPGLNLARMRADGRFIQHTLPFLHREGGDTRYAHKRSASIGHDLDGPRSASDDIRPFDVPRCRATCHDRPQHVARNHRHIVREASQRRQ